MNTLKNLTNKRKRNSLLYRYQLTSFLVVITLFFGSSSSLEASCTNYDASNSSCPGRTISSMDGVNTDKNQCIVGVSNNHDDPDYYKFTVQAFGTLDITGTSPNYHNYHLKVGSSCGGDDYYTDHTSIPHNVPTINLIPGDTVYIYAKETGYDTDRYQIEFDFKVDTTFKANDDEYSIPPNASISMDVEHNDNPGANGPLQNLTITTSPLHGTATVNGNKIDYTPNNDYLGNDSLIYSVQDSNGAISHATVNIEIGTIKNRGDRYFTIRNPLSTRNITGNYAVIGNSNQCALHSTITGSLAGYCYQSGSNSNPSRYIDIDNNTNTKNSTSSTLNINSNSTVLWAGLYWQGVVHNSTHSNDFMGDSGHYNGITISGEAQFSTGRQIDFQAAGTTYDAEKVLFKVPNGNYVEISADVLDYHNLGYAGFKDVTNMINTTNPNGTYMVADIKSHQGVESNHGNYAAWSLVVIYENKNEKFRNITLFDGYATIDSSFEQDLLMSGFLTPNTPPIESKLATFVMDGDGGSNHMTITSQNNISTLVENDNSLFDSSISSTIIRNPNSTSLRTDLRVFNLLNALGPSETEAILQPRSGGDRYTPSYFIMSAELRTINICYDYTYGQNGFYQTAPSIKPVRVEGEFTSDPIDVKLYFKNQENSDVTMKNLSIDIDPIDSNTTYKPESTYVAKPRETIVQVHDSNHNTSANYNNDIPIGDVGSLDYFYAYYSLNHSQDDINATINATLKYDLVVKINNDFITLNNTSTKLKDMDPCQGGSSYKPNYGQFNIVHKSYTKNNDPYYYFNLPTQVVNRYTDNYLVESMDPDDVNKSKTGVVDQNVTVEMIDVAGFHYASASCTDQNATVISSQSVLATFDNNNTYEAALDKTEMQNAAFFSRAVQNAAFKLGYYKDANATQRTYICSRDNFAIRPEAFMLQIKDQNQTNSSSQVAITTLSDSGSASAVTPDVQLASGYDYKLEVNATNFIGNNASPGYTRVLNATSPDNAMYKWTPRSITAATAATNCNDESNSTLSVVFNDGKVDINTSLSQTGEYTLSLKDASWTVVDYDSALMTHHTGSNFYSSNTPDCILYSDVVQSIANTALNGCEIHSKHRGPNNIQYNDFNVTFHPYTFSIVNTVTFGKGNGGTGVPASAMKVQAKPFVYMNKLSDDENMSVHLNTTVTAVGQNGTALSNFVKGCFEQPLNINISRTATSNTALAYSYIVHNKDSNGSVISADDINQTIAAGTALQNPAFATTGSFFQKDQNGTIQLRTNLNYDRDVNVTTNPEDVNFTAITVNDNATLFNADLVNNKYAEGNISVNQRVLYYYGRTIAPKIRVICNKKPCRTGMHASNNNNIKELITYAIYCNGGSCNASILPNDLPANQQQVGDIRWFKNTYHDFNLPLGTDGTIGAISEVSTPGHVSEVNRSISAANYETEAVMELNNTAALPYDALMQMQSSPWLIYNASDANAATNQFIIKFVGEGGWSGKFEDNTTTKTNESGISNRRIMW